MAGNAEAKPAAQRGADWLHTALLDRIVPYAGAAELSAYRSIDEHGGGWQHRQYDGCTGGMDRRLPALALRRARRPRSSSDAGVVPADVGRICHGRMAGTAWPLPSGHLPHRSEEHTSELQSLMRISYAVFCLKKKKTKNEHDY